MRPVQYQSKWATSESADGDQKTAGDILCKRGSKTQCGECASVSHVGNVCIEKQPGYKQGTQSVLDSSEAMGGNSGRRQNVSEGM